MCIVIIIIGALTKPRQHPPFSFWLGVIWLYASDQSGGVESRSRRYSVFRMGLGRADLPSNTNLLCIIGIYKYPHKTLTSLKLLLGIFQ